EEMVRAMAASGCIAVSIGMESGNPTILKQVRKPGTLRNFLAAAEAFRKVPEIHARVFVMIGFPGETLAMINDTINVSREMDLDWSSIAILYPLPNTPIYDSMVEQGLVQELGSTEVRFNAGGYGKQDEIDLGLRLASQGFAEAFSAIPMDAVPTQSQLSDIWFYMNYHLNFHRLFSETREVKLRQQLLNLTALSDVISPEHGFALYFTGYIQHKLTGHIDPALRNRLKTKLEQSAYWSDRLQAFGLSVNDLDTLDFRNKHIPRLLPGRVPEGS
ncbi:MAG: B12-binding domain-containing radical SAM protein, partial [Alphaproteobacteria bacterium]